jgi:hypothetical protein
MMVRFDDEKTTMQVRAPFLERVDYGEQLPFMHRIVHFCTGEFPRGKGDWMGSSLAFLLQTATIPMSLAPHVTMYGL